MALNTSKFHRRSCRAWIVFGLAVPVVLLTSHASADDYQTPLDDAHITQLYNGCCSESGKFHAGLDLISPSGDRTVLSAHPGVARVLENWRWNDNANHCMGNVVIVDHRDRTHALYAHLRKISVEDGQVVNKTTKIGEYGKTGANGPRCDDEDFAPHLHFEIKNWNVMGALNDHKNESHWGYTPNLPNWHGYINPLPYIEHDLEQFDDLKPGCSTWGSRTIS